MLDSCKVAPGSRGLCSPCLACSPVHSWLKLYNWCVNFHPRNVEEGSLVQILVGSPSICLVSDEPCTAIFLRAVLCLWVHSTTLRCQVGTWKRHIRVDVSWAHTSSARGRGTPNFTRPIATECNVE